MVRIVVHASLFLWSYLLEILTEALNAAFDGIVNRAIENSNSYNMSTVLDHNWESICEKKA